MECELLLLTQTSPINVSRLLYKLKGAIESRLVASGEQVDVQNSILNIRRKKLISSLTSLTSFKTFERSYSFFFKCFKCPLRIIEIHSIYMLDTDGRRKMRGMYD